MAFKTRLEELNNEALASTILLYDKKEIQNVIDTFAKTEILDSQLRQFLRIICNLSLQNMLDNLPRKVDERQPILIKMIDAQISTIPDAQDRESFTDWFMKVKQEKPNIELADQLFYRYLWAEWLHRLNMADGSSTPFKDKLAIQPVLPDLQDDEIKVIANIDMSEEHKRIFTTGIKSLDKLVKMEQSNFVVIAARTSIGKSLFMLQMAVKTAINEKVLYVSLEESDKEIRRRVENISSEPSVLTNMILYTPSTGNPDAVLPQVQTIIQRENIDVVFIDYLQLLKYPDKGDFESLRALTRELKLFAVKNDVLLVTASQLRRDAELTGASLSTLFGSSSIEHDANTVLMLETKRRSNVRIDGEVPATIQVQKNRGGSQGIIDVLIDYSRGRIAE